MTLLLCCLGTAFMTAVITAGLIHAPRELAAIDRAQADYELRAAQAVREQADEMLATAEALVAGHTPQTQPRPRLSAQIRVRAGAMWTDLRDWADNLGSDQSTDWAEGELAAIAAMPLDPPPLRTRQHLAPQRRTWPLKQAQPRPAFPTPAQLATRLAQLPDPTRRWRVQVVRHA